MKEAERATRVAELTFGTAWLLILGGCAGVPLAGVRLANDLEILGYFGAGAFVAFIGLCVLPFAMGLRIKAKWMRQRVNLVSRDQPRDLNGHQ